MSLSAHISQEPARVGGRPDWVSAYMATVVAMMAIQASSLGFSPLIPFMKDAWSMSYTQVGTFTGVYGLVALVMSVPAGLLAKRFGEKRVLLLGLGLAALGLAAVGCAMDYLQGLAARTMWIFGYRLAFICVMTAVAVTVPSNQRGKAMGLLGALTALATIIGSGFSARMEAAFGWRLTMVGFAAFALCGAVCFGYFYHSGFVATSRDDSGGTGSAKLFSAFKVPVVWVIPLLGLANAGGFAATFFVPSVVRTVFHADAAQASLIISAAYTLAIVCNPICGWLADRFDRWLVMAGISALMVPACFLMSSGNFHVFGLATTVLIALGHVTANQVYPTAAELLRGRDAGPVMGIVGLGSGLFGYLGPLALGWMRDYSGGFDLGWHVIMGTTCAIVLLLVYLKHYAHEHNRSETR
jgi:MFS transporter, NNP family, nitrate/nitrite transporter